MESAMKRNDSHIFLVDSAKEFSSQEKKPELFTQTKIL
jgi:hypothetical protein